MGLIWPHGWAGVMQENEVVKAQPYGENYHPCNWLWKSLAIYWDGRVASCCADFSSDQVIGDVRRQSLKEIWNGSPWCACAGCRWRRYKEASLCSGCDALWQKDSTAWHAFTRAERAVRPRHLPTEAPQRGARARRGGAGAGGGRGGPARGGGARRGDANGYRPDGTPAGVPSGVPVGPGPG